MNKHMSCVIFFFLVIIHPNLNYSQVQKPVYHIIKTKKYIFSLSNKTFYENNKNIKKKYPRAEPYSSIATGIFGGFVLGITIARFLPGDTSHDLLLNKIRGAIIGASIFPFINYELMIKRAGIPNELNRWSFDCGGNITQTNHDRQNTKIGYLFGISRHYHFGDKLNFVGGVYYNLRQFLLMNQKVYYGTSSFEEIRNYNITFNVGYLDVLLMPNYNITISNFHFGLGIGPSISVQVYDNTNYKIFKVEEVNGNINDIDFAYETDEPSYTLPYFSCFLNFNIKAKRLFAQFKIKKALGKSHQIFPLNDETKLSTFEFTFGYFLN